jgi:hypothetical protein
VAIGGELATPSWPSMEVSPDENPIPPFPGRGCGDTPVDVYVGYVCLLYCSWSFW